MRLWDLLELHTDTNDNIMFVLFMGGVREEYPLDFIPYAYLVEKVQMWEIDYDMQRNVVLFKVWVGEKGEVWNE